MDGAEEAERRYRVREVMLELQDAAVYYDIAAQRVDGDKLYIFGNIVNVMEFVQENRSEIEELG